VQISSLATIFLSHPEEGWMFALIVALFCSSIAYIKFQRDYEHWRLQKFFQGGNVNVLLIFSGCWRCSATGRLQNSLPFPSHQESAPCYGNSQQSQKALRWQLSLSLLVVRLFDDDAAQRVSLCRRMWFLSPKAEAQTRPHTVQVYPRCVVVGCGWLHCWCLRARFATATSICCCSKVASTLSQTARHS